MTAPTIVEFLRARLGEDENDARRAAFWHGPAWAAERVGPYLDPDGLDPDIARYIARHDPASVLADVKAKRAIVGRYIDNRPHPPNAYDLALLDVMRDLATAYADHPEYRQEWKP